VLSAFCGDLQTVLGHEASGGKGPENPDALKLLERLDVKAPMCTAGKTGKIVIGGCDLLPEIDCGENLRARRRL